MHSATGFLREELEWLHPPTSWHVDDASGVLEGSGGSFDISADGTVLKLMAPSKKDFWSRTFYNPLLIKSDASALLCCVPVELEATISIDFDFNPISQFDQAGMLVYLDPEHWIKCGIEFCDGAPRLSVVVCNIYSDWSTQPWSCNAARLRVHKVLQSDSFVVEAAACGTEDFHFIRIGHLSARSSHRSNATDLGGVFAGSEEEKPWRIGPFAACPVRQAGCQATFTNFNVGPRKASVHSDDLSIEGFE